jgi:DNA polymerase-3 subunit delta'
LPGSRHTLNTSIRVLSHAGHVTSRFIGNSVYQQVLLCWSVPFRTIAGHQRLLALLSRAIARDTLPPSLLFAGTRGIGKRPVAAAIAETLNCLNPRAEGAFEIDACGECAACKRIMRGVHPDVIVIEPGDTGSIKIDPIRDVIDRSNYRPFEGKRRVVIVDDADALVEAAQHALLKTLEEPPPASVFILISSMADVLLPTVRSRCRPLRLSDLSPADVAAILVRDHGYAQPAAHAAAAEAGGSIGRALEARSVDVADARASAQRLLEQAARLSDPARRLDGARDLTGKPAPAAIERDRLAVCLRALSSLLRDLGVLSTHADRAVLANADIQADLVRLSGAFDAERTTHAFSAVDRALAALERNVNPKVVADWVVLQI